MPSNQVEAAARSWHLENPLGWGVLLLLIVGSALPEPARGVAGFVTACGCVAVMGWVPRRRLPPSETRPWLLFAAAGAVVLLGHVAVTVVGTGVADRPTASWADGIYLIGYGLLVAAEVSLARRRQAEAEGDHVLDALLVAVTVTALAAVLVELPFAHPDQPLMVRLVSAAYTVADTALVAGAARLALGEGSRTRSWYLLVAGWASLLVVDLWPLGSAPPVFLAYLPFAFVAAAAAHPSMRVLTAGAAPQEAQLTSRRMALLCLAMLLPSGLLVAALLTERRVAVGVLSVASVINALLVLARMGALVRAKERTARRERALGDLAARLLTASDIGEIEELATNVACDLAGPDATARLLPPDGARPPARPAGHHVTTLLFRAPTGSMGALAVTSPRTPSPATRRALEHLVDHVSLALVGAKLRDEAQRRRTERRFRAFIDHSSDLVIVIGRTGRISSASPAVKRLIGISPDLLVGMNPARLVHPDDRELIDGLVAAAWTGDEHVEPIEARLQRHDGTVRRFEIAASSFNGDGTPGVALNMRDVTEAKNLEELLLHRTLHDALTGLPNRTLFAERVECALARSVPDDGHVVVLFIDLDDFKTVNDGLGHDAGDLVLSAAASRVVEAIGAGGLVARLGGDEFAVLLEGPESPRLAGQVGLRLVAALGQPTTMGGGLPVQLGASVGIAANDTAGHSVSELLRGADVAMYLAKGRGKARVERYVAGMNAAVFERLEMKQDLVRALVADQMSVVFQPVVDLVSGRVTAVEALARWEHPTRGSIPPAAFIPLAEDTGLIHSLGMFVLEQACHHLQALTHAGHQIALHVNVSARQLEDDAFTSRCAQTISRNGLPMGSVTLELTESAPTSPVHQATLDELHDLGVRIAIDDFGTGYASWGQLADLPVDILKLDRSFVSCLRSEQTVEVVRAIIDVAKAHDVVVVAEGVERPEERTILVALGCQEAQGWLFSHALTADQLDSYLGLPAAGTPSPS